MEKVTITKETAAELVLTACSKTNCFFEDKARAILIKANVLDEDADYKEYVTAVLNATPEQLQKILELY